MSGALADGVGRVGAVPFWRVGMWDGDRVVLLLWTVLAWLDHMDHNGARRDQMKSGQDESSGPDVQCSVDVLDQKVGNKIDLILA